MKNYTKLLAAAFAVASAMLSPSANAQLLGDRSVEASFDVTDYSHGVNTSYGGSLSVNVPVLSYMDLSFGYSYERLDQNGVTVHQNLIGVSDILYVKKDSVAPFIGATLGWDFLSASSGYASASENSVVYGGVAGVEWKASEVFSVTPGIQYSYVDKAKDGVLNYGLRGVYSVTKEWAITGLIALTDDSDAVYSIGIARKF